MHNQGCTALPQMARKTSGFCHSSSSAQRVINSKTRCYVARSQLVKTSKPVRQVVSRNGNKAHELARSMLKKRWPIVAG
jgi:hypothetical protein